MQAYGSGSPIVGLLNPDLHAHSFCGSRYRRKHLSTKTRENAKELLITANKKTVMIVIPEIWLT